MTLRRETCLDKKILTGLLKGQNMTMHYQLYLSMVWDRVDIAEEKIFVHGSECLGKQSSIRWVVKNLTVGYKISMILLPNEMCLKEIFVIF